MDISVDDTLVEEEKEEKKSIIAIRFRGTAVKKSGEASRRSQNVFARTTQNVKNC